MHHIVPISEGETATPNNLIVVTLDEHKAIHGGKLKIPKSKIKKVKILKDATYILGQYIVNELKKEYNVEVTFGSVTKAKRIELGLTRGHREDAFVIAGGTVQEWYFESFLEDRNILYIKQIQSK